MVRCKSVPGEKRGFLKPALKNQNRAILLFCVNLGWRILRDKTREKNRL